MPKLTTEELVTIIEQIYPTLSERNQDEARQLVRQLNNNENDTETPPARRIINWQASVHALDRFIRENIEEEHYRYITINITQQRTIDQCLAILQAARPLLLSQINERIETLIFNIGLARHQLSHPERFTEEALENTRNVYITNLATLKTITGQIIEVTTE
jgi:phenylpropionate dioxygenase-like ring-hydroxylating dioxygenase large terminal subunit